MRASREAGTGDGFQLRRLSRVGSPQLAQFSRCGWVEFRASGSGQGGEGFFPPLVEQLRAAIQRAGGRLRGAAFYRPSATFTGQAQHFRSEGRIVTAASTI